MQWLFAGVSLSGLLFALFFLPETHGKKLKDIEDHFMGKKAAAEKEWMTTKSLINGGGAAGGGGDLMAKRLTQKPSTRRGERKISRNSLTCVPEVEQTMIVVGNGEEGGKGCREAV